VGAAELAKLPYSGLAEGFYAVGTGATGAAEALAVIGAGYFGVILLSSMLIRNPHPSYRPAGMPAETAASAAAKVKGMQWAAVIIEHHLSDVRPCLSLRGRGCRCPT
jgi:hypothetical protein